MGGRWILLPGTLCTGEVFSPLLDQLEVPCSERITIPINCPSIDDLKGSLPLNLGLNDVLVGFSLGAIGALHLLPYLPRLKGALILAGSARADRVENLMIRRRIEERIKSGDIEGVIDEAWPNYVSAEKQNDEKLREYVLTMAKSAAVSISAQTELALSRPGVLDQLATVETPILAVTGANDIATPPFLAAEIAAQAGHGSAVVIPNCGHFALLEEPSQLAYEIKKWFWMYNI